MGSVAGTRTLTIRPSAPPRRPGPVCSWCQIRGPIDNEDGLQRELAEVRLDLMAMALAGPPIGYAMKERGLRPWWGSESLETRGSHNQPSDKEEEAAMDREYVGIDFHRRRSVIVRKNAAGERLSSVRVRNDAWAIASAVMEAGPEPEVVIEATYGWYWIVALLQEQGATVHLANPSG
jgi:hypothetical protein